MPCVTSCVWCNIAQLLFLVAHISATFSDAITTSELIVALSSNLLSHGLNNVACAIQVSCVKRQKWEVGVERWQVSNLIPVACSLRTAVPGAIVRPHKYGNCCEKEGQLLSVGVVYYLRVISGFPCQLFTPRVQCCLSQVQWILLQDQQIFHHPGEPSLCSLVLVFIDPYIIQSHLTLLSPFPLFCQRLKNCCCL